jgi:tRNA-dihydrouridine synthase B
MSRPTTPMASALLRRLADPNPVLALAPMQDVTDLAFWRLLAARGGPDIYWTEYFRVHSTWRPERWILESLRRNPSDRPAIAQIIGNDPEALATAADELAGEPVAAIDLNLGCPAPVVYRKCAGGGLLRDLPRVDAILGGIRAATRAAGVLFTVKTRIGFSDTEPFEPLLKVLARHEPDLVTVHARTVADGYRATPRFDFVRRAAQSLACPILANGEISTPADALRVIAHTGARGVMIGRGCIRNPWLFDQIRAAAGGQPSPRRTGRDLLAYIGDLWAGTVRPDSPERTQVQHMKRYMNFIGLGLGGTQEESADFLWRIRRARSAAEFFATCRDLLDHDEPLPAAPWRDNQPVAVTGGG